MAYSYNQVTLVGRLTKNPELKQVSDNASKSIFTLAVNRTYRKSDGTTDTDFIPVCMWGKLAEISFQLLNKGTPVLVWGKIQVRSYEKGNEVRWITEVVADNFQILDKHTISEREDRSKEKQKEEKMIPS
ncbi:MAG: single-stranded DNA-binding protein [bacterium]|nr:single-stranded DNA-binding protein [bacterium]